MSKGASIYDVHRILGFLDTPLPVHKIYTVSLQKCGIPLPYYADVIHKWKPPKRISAFCKAEKEREGGRGRRPVGASAWVDGIRWLDHSKRGARRERCFKTPGALGNK